MRKKFLFIAFFFFFNSTLFSQTALLLFAGQGSTNGHKTFLGCLNCSENDPSSIFNKSGKYGSAFSQTSIWNKYAEYGSQYGQHSPFNLYCNYPPVIVDKNGGFYGYFTINKNFPKRSNLALSEEILQIIGGNFGYQKNSIVEYNYVEQEFPEPVLFQPNWSFIQKTLASATARVEELYRNGYVFDETKRSFIKKEVYLEKVNDKKSAIKTLNEEFKKGGMGNLFKVDDGYYNVGFYSANFQTDEVLYAIAKIKDGALIYVEYTFEGVTTKLYPQIKKNSISLGIFRGMLVYTKVLRTFAPKGHETILHVLSKVSNL